MKKVKFKFDERTNKAVAAMLEALGCRKTNYITGTSYCWEWITVSENLHRNWYADITDMDCYDYEEIDISWMLPDEEKTMQVGGKTYRVSDVERALNGLEAV